MQFDKPYNREDFSQFMRSFLPDDFTPEENVIADLTRNPRLFIQSAVKLGKCETLDLEVFEVTHLSTHDARIGLSCEAFRLMQKYSYCNRALIAFIPVGNSEQWRFSLLQIELEQQDHSVRLTKNYSNPRRYSFLLGEDEKIKTPKQFLIDEGKVRARKRNAKDYTAWEDLCYRFSIEPLTKEFYAELSNWYFWALQSVAFPGDNATSVIRLITRLMFVWFLKQKKLISEELFDKEELDNILNYNDKTGSTFYKAILQNLFFATLNTEMGEKRKFVNRQSDIQNDIQSLYCYERFFKNKERFLELTENTPFLNGGLFENLDKNVGEKNEIRIDCFSNRIDKEELLKVPDFLFFGNERRIDLNKIYDTTGKTYKVRGLIDILKTYNFTIEENTPTDVEVALDPELMGKVFENLLASFNPETQTTARKQTGSFYTPREIVDYMVNESLTAYLQEKVGNDWENNLQTITALNEVKILDPACGSGAFPMGILKKMVHILQTLDPENKLWREIQKQKAILETEDAYNIGDKEERQKRLIDIDEAFDNNSSDYGRKLYLIENSIFGVDIQPIAAQISKLRFFISLICEQTPNPQKPNLGIRPLPNLETKFVAANTLIGLDKSKQTNMFRTREIINKENELKEVRRKHFSARTPETKDKYRKKDEQLRCEITDILASLGYAEDTTQKLARWNPYDQNTSSPFFDAEWMFGLSEGFDVVIGNPPYVDYRKIEETQKKYLAKYEIAQHSKMINLYTYFFEKGINLLKEKGFLIYITPQQYLILDHCKGLRDVFRKNRVIFLSDFSNVRVFEAGTYPFISFISKEKSETPLKYFEFNSTDNLHAPIRTLNLPNPISEPVCISDYTEIINKIEIFDKKLKDITTDIFCASSSTLTPCEDITKIPFVTASDIQNYYMTEIIQFIDKKEYSTQSIQKQKGNVIYTSRMTKTIRACLVENNQFLGGKINVIKVNSKKASDKFILGILNSKLINFWYREKYQMQHLQGGYLPVNTTELKEIPIPNISIEQQKPIITLVNQILSAKKENPAADTLTLEQSIDLLVYKLYGLIFEEVKIIDIEFQLSKEEYEKYR